MFGVAPSDAGGTPGGPAGGCVETFGTSTRTAADIKPRRPFLSSPRTA
jgi:hypothetical protein